MYIKDASVICELFAAFDIDNLSNIKDNISFIFQM